MHKDEIEVLLKEGNIELQAIITGKRDVRFYRAINTKTKEIYAESEAYHDIQDIFEGAVLNEKYQAK